jgi:phosphatidate phosphatase PAH1
MYDKKLKGYKSKQADLLQQTQDHNGANENYYLTAARLLDICKRAIEIFESSEPLEKRQFLNSVLQSSVVNSRKLVFNLQTPFNHILKLSSTNEMLRIVNNVTRGESVEPEPFLSE